MKKWLMVCTAISLLAVTPGSAAADAADPLRGEQWGLDQIHAPEAWATSTGEGVTIAVVDTGVDLTHPDLAENLVAGATIVGCAPTHPTCGDGSWGGAFIDIHGTHVAGIAAAPRNGVGIAGVAPDASILPVKVLQGGAGAADDVAQGIVWAADNGADVINMSLGTLPGGQVLTSALFPELVEAVKYARDAGVVVVAAAGNTSDPLCTSPAWEDGALCVVATESSELRSGYSSGGIKPDQQVVAAPGGALAAAECNEMIVGPVPRGNGGACHGQPEDHEYLAGTSMAAPHVSGVAALLLAQGATDEKVVETLLATARTPLAEDTRGQWTPVWGYGVVDAAAATAEVGTGDMR